MDALWLGCINCTLGSENHKDVLWLGCIHCGKKVVLQRCCRAISPQPEINQAKKAAQLWHTVQQMLSKLSSS
jgi:hypothetical protein